MGTPDIDMLLWLYRTMVTIRMFEERVKKEFGKGDMPGFVHSYAGEEAIAAGVCAHLDDDDYITSTHRGHGHCIAKGCDLSSMLAELYGRETGLCKGRGGSMHIADFRRGMLGANAIVGGGIALATGGALANQVRGSDRVAVSFFGDGAANQGVLHEALNLASIWQLPVVFVCENNGWAESTPFSYATSVPTVAQRATGYGIPGVTVDARDVLDVYDIAGEAIERARAGNGPTLLEALAPRLEGHYVGDPEAYRDRVAKKSLEQDDPIPRLEARLMDEGVLSEEYREGVREEIRRELDAGVAHAHSSPLPEPEAVTAFVYAT